MQARDPVIKAPDEMVMIARVSVLLRGMGNAFNIRLRMAEAWRADAEKLLSAHGPRLLSVVGQRFVLATGT